LTEKHNGFVTEITGLISQITTKIDQLPNSEEKDRFSSHFDGLKLRREQLVRVCDETIKIALADLLRDIDVHHASETESRERLNVIVLFCHQLFQKK
jgi:hypothetical protein